MDYGWTFWVLYFYLIYSLLVRGYVSCEILAVKTHNLSLEYLSHLKNLKSYFHKLFKRVYVHNDTMLEKSGQDMGSGWTLISFIAKRLPALLNGGFKVERHFVHENTDTENETTCNKLLALKGIIFLIM